MKTAPEVGAVGKFTPKSNTHIEQNFGYILERILALLS